MPLRAGGLPDIFVFHNFSFFLASNGRSGDFWNSFAMKSVRKRQEMFQKICPGQESLEWMLILSECDAGVFYQ